MEKKSKITAMLSVLLVSAPTTAKKNYNIKSS